VHHEEWPRLQSTPEEREEAETHLVAPVEILENQYDRVAPGELS
jgi:hypothetical protein